MSQLSHLWRSSQTEGAQLLSVNVHDAGARPGIPAREVLCEERGLSTTFHLGHSHLCVQTQQAAGSQYMSSLTQHAQGKAWHLI